MATSARPRPAHVPGPTFLCYTPNGRRLVTVGSNSTIRVFETGFDGEPVNIDDCRDGNTAIVATNDFFIAGSEDGAVSLYSLETNSFERILLRCSLPIRSLAISQDKAWVAVASDELVVQLVNIQDMSRVRRIPCLSKSAKHVSFDPNGALLTVSCTDGSVQVYSITTEEPELVKEIDGLIKSLDSEDQSSSYVAWHPDGRSFGVPTATRDVQIISKRDWEKERAFKDGHVGDITALAWSHNGALLVTSGMDKTVCLWDTGSQKIIKRYNNVRAPIWAFSWHPTENILSYTTNEGELYIHTNFVPLEQASYLEKGLQASPFIHDPLSEISPNILPSHLLHGKGRANIRGVRSHTPDSLDDILGPDDVSDADGFVEDDDGFGYAEEAPSRKRSNGHLDALDQHITKRRPYGASQSQLHEPLQPGSTPWRGNRRYLCLNLIGCIWVVDHDTHHTITVEFYDRDFQRDFHFTDPDRYDKACLSEKGTLFSNQPLDKQSAVIHYRPHETWTVRNDWRTSLPPEEHVVAIALSEAYIVVATSTDYVRVFTLFGTPVSIWRNKFTPITSCISWRDYIMTVGNGAVGGGGTSKLMYRIENVKRDEVCQSEDYVALPNGAHLQGLFFSGHGDPCIYDSTGVLLILLHWRNPNQARWVPLLDTKLLSRRVGGGKEESYWPVAVASEKFYCIILKGSERHPYFPRPLLNEFEFSIPFAGPRLVDDMTNNIDDGAVVALQDVPQTTRLEELYLRHTLLHALQDDFTSGNHSTQLQRVELQRRALEADKVLLQLLAVECMEGEQRGMKALEIVGLLKDADGSGKMLEAAVKIAARFRRDALGERIRELAERRLIDFNSN